MYYIAIIIQRVVHNNYTTQFKGFIVLFSKYTTHSCIYRDHLKGRKKKKWRKPHAHFAIKKKSRATFVFHDDKISCLDSLELTLIEFYILLCRILVFVFVFALMSLSKIWLIFLEERLCNEIILSQVAFLPFWESILPKIIDTRSFHFLTRKMFVLIFTLLICLHIIYNIFLKKRKNWKRF